MERGLRNDTLALPEGDNSLVKVRAEIRVVGTGERELEFGLLSVISEFRGEIAMFPKIRLTTANRADDDTVKRHSSVNIFAVSGKDVMLGSSPFSDSKKVIGRRILGKQDEFRFLEGATEGQIAIKCRVAS